MRKAGPRHRMRPTLSGARPDAIAGPLSGTRSEDTWHVEYQKAERRYRALRDRFEYGTKP